MMTKSKDLIALARRLDEIREELGNAAGALPLHIRDEITTARGAISRARRGLNAEIGAAVVQEHVNAS